MGRLAALLAAGTLIATGGRGCRQEPSTPTPEEPRAGLGGYDRERVNDPPGGDRNGGGERRSRDWRKRRRRDGKPEKPRVRRHEARRERATREQARPKRAERGQPKREGAKRERPQREQTKRGRAGDQLGVPPPAPSGPPAPPASEAEGLPPAGGAEQIVRPKPEPAPQPPKSGEFTPDPPP